MKHNRRQLLAALGSLALSPAYGREGSTPGPAASPTDLSRLGRATFHIFFTAEASNTIDDIQHLVKPPHAELNIDDYRPEGGQIRGTIKKRNLPRHPITGQLSGGAGTGYTLKFTFRDDSAGTFEFSGTLYAPVAPANAGVGDLRYLMFFAGSYRTVGGIQVVGQQPDESFKPFCAFERPSIR
jgi:hypothetical protein